MKPLPLLFLLCVTGTSALVPFAPAPASDPGAAGEIQGLVKQLGSDVFREREAATKRLTEIGEAALDALHPALTSDDPEVRRRAGDVVAAIDHQLYGQPVCLTGHTSGVWIVSVAADGQRLLTSSGDTTLRLWDTDTGKQLRVFSGHTECIVAAALSSDGRRVLSGSGDKTVRLWDATTGKQLAQVICPDQVFCVAFGPEGKALSGGNDRIMHVWDLNTGKEAGVFPGHKSHVRGVSYSDGARLAATGSDDRSIRLWDLDAGKEVRQLTGHAEQVVTVCFSPDGKRLLSAGYDHTVRLWEVATGKELKRLPVPGAICAAFSPDGKRIVTGGIRDNSTVQVWDTDGGQELRKYAGHTGGIGSVTFFPDGKRVASASDDGTARIWRAPR
jgi:WD40 repeat protein